MIEGIKMGIEELLREEVRTASKVILNQWKIV